MNLRRYIKYNKISVKNKLYITFLIFITIFSIQFYFNNVNHEELSLKSNLINVTGKQRMLTEQMVKFSYLIIMNAENDDSFTSLQNTRKIFEESHLEIRFGTSNLKGLGSKESIDQWIKVNSSWYELRPYILLLEQEGNQNNLSFLLNDINFKHKELITNLDILVSQMEKEAILANQNLINFNYLFMTTILIGMVLFMFITDQNISKPLKKIQNSFQDISQRKTNFQIDNSLIKRDDEIGELYSSFLKVVDFYQKSEKAFRIRSEFLAKLNHEIRNPLFVIFGILAELKEIDDYALIPKKELIMLKRANKNLLNLINDILDLSEIQSLKTVPVKSQIKLKNLGQEICRENLKKTTLKNLNFTLIIEENIPEYVSGDEKRIKQILNNLLDNAIKYTANGGQIEFKIKKINSDNANPSQIKIQFSITDTGIGIPQDENIFEMFSRGSNVKSTIQGTGLGLNISETLSDMLQGDLYFESQINVGSIFYFELNFEILNKNKIIQKSQNKDQQKDSLKIIISTLKGNLIFVDNFVELHTILKLYLKDTQLDIDCVDNGFDALDLIQKKDYDIFLIDLRMPEMSGYELARKIIRLYAEDSNRSLRPMLALTGDSQDDRVLEAINTGFSDVLIKPFKKEELILILNNLL